VNINQLLVIGLDGATLDLIRPWAAQGHLPHLAQLIAQGTHGLLESTLPPVTSPAWPSFVTGKNPGRHGVFDFIRPRAGGPRTGAFDMVNASQIDGRMIWEYLSDAGYSCGVLNVPITYPPRKINGYLVPGLLSPDQGKTTWPPDFLKPYEAELGPYRLTPRVSYKAGNEGEFIADLADLIDTQTRYALRLMRDHPTDFTMVHFLATDNGQHALWKHQDTTHPDHDPAQAARYANAIRDIYARLDAIVGQMIALVPDATVIVMSDHGFGPLHRIVNLNMLFLETGLLALKRTPWVQLRAWAFKRGLTPASVWKLIERIGLQNMVTRFSRKARNQVVNRFLGFEDVDWSRTLAYSMGHVGQVYLNLKGREPQGIVEPGDYVAVRQRVMDVLRQLPVPVDRIIPREEVASGAYLDRAPDLHLILDGYRTIAFPLFATDGKIVTRQIRGDSGCHRLHGVLIARGPSIAKGKIEGARIIDLAPTILHLMNVPVPDDMDGRVLTEALVSHSPIETQAAVPASHAQEDLTAEEAAEVEERLRALGYLS
jgi:predicted AlkP superfamily phosphohydrolase/phosphomutase